MLFGLGQMEKKVKKVEKSFVGKILMIVLIFAFFKELYCCITHFWSSLSLVLFFVLTSPGLKVALKQRLGPTEALAHSLIELNKTNILI